MHIFRLNVLAIALMIAAAHAKVNAAIGIMSLTGAGTTAGFTLSTFADAFPTGTHIGLDIGPLGIGFNNTGGVLVSDFFGDIRSFPTHADGQHAGTPSAFYDHFSTLGIENSGGNIYLARHVANSVVQIADDGTFIKTIATGTTTSRDIVVNPLTGHLFVSSADGIWDVDPSNPNLATNKTLVLPGQTDGLAINGTTLYAAREFEGSDFNRIEGYEIGAWGVMTFNSGVIDGVDGIAVGFGSLSGKIYGATNFGELWEVDLANPSNKTLIGTGGSRGDLVKVDPTDGSLLFTQSDRVLRLTAPAGGGFEPAAVPEPASLALWSLGALGCVMAGFRRRKQAA